MNHDKIPWKDIGWEERFDSRFGKPGPEKNSDSIGRIAGCDDCSDNILRREEHKSFLREELLLQEHRLKELAQQKCLSECLQTRERTIEEKRLKIIKLYQEIFEADPEEVQLQKHHFNAGIAYALGALVSEPTIDLEDTGLHLNHLNYD